MKKSYHSSAVPTVAPATTRRSAPGRAGCGCCPSLMNRLMLVLLPSGPRAPTTSRPGAGPRRARVCARVRRSISPGTRTASKPRAGLVPASASQNASASSSKSCPEGGRVERDQHCAVRRLALLAEHAGAAERAADELDHHAQARALVRAERQQRAAGVEVGRVARGLAVRVDEHAVGDLLAASERDGQLALGHRGGRPVHDQRRVAGAARPRRAGWCRAGARARRTAPPSARRCRRRARRGPRRPAPRPTRRAGRRGWRAGSPPRPTPCSRASSASSRDRQPRRDLAEAAVAVDDHGGAAALRRPRARPRGRSGPRDELQVAGRARRTPCESWPRRFDSTSDSATAAAVAGGAPASSRTARARCSSSPALWMLSM